MSAVRSAGSGVTDKLIRHSFLRFNGMDELMLYVRVK